MRKLVFFLPLPNKEWRSNKAIKYRTFSKTLKLRGQKIPIKSADPMEVGK